ncbi:MAG: FAD:protein FMN transferase [Niabella sp.]
MQQFYSNYFESSSMLHGSMNGIMGTRLDMLLPGIEKNEAESIWHQSIAELIRLDKMLNRFDGESELSYINKEAVKTYVGMSCELWNILTSCKKYHADTGGLFDITLNDFLTVSFDESAKTVFFTNPDLIFDLGAYAKGYALRQIKKILTGRSVKSAFVDFGNSSVLAIGSHPHGDSWHVSIENPFNKGEILGSVKLKDQAMSTSGNTPAHTKHIMNPVTKEYLVEKKIVSVVVDCPAEAEVITTALMIADEEKNNIIQKNFVIDSLKIYNNLN